MQVKILELSDKVMVIVRDNYTTIADRYVFDSIDDAKAFTDTL